MVECPVRKATTKKSFQNKEDSNSCYCPNSHPQIPINIRKLLCTILILLSAITVRAQGDVEYMMEVGGGLGLMSY